MAKKIIAALIVAAVAGAFAFAQSASPAPAAPKVGIQLTQLIDAETNDAAIKASGVYTAPGDAEYARTNLKGQIDFDLGGGVKISPWAQERLEIKLNPGDLTTTLVITDPGVEGVTKDTASELLGALRFRNRAYLGLNSSFAIDKAFNLGLNFEYRIATDLRSDKTGTPFNELRFTPFLVLSGKVDPLYYSITEDLPIYLDPTAAGSIRDNSKAEGYLELEGTYNVGVQLAIDTAASLKIEGNFYIDLINLANNINANSAAANLAYELRPKAILVAGDLSPFAGFLLSTKTTTAISTDGVAGSTTVTNNSIVGATVGIDVKTGANSTFNVTYDFGVDNGAAASVVGGTSHQPFVSALNAALVVKF